MSSTTTPVARLALHRFASPEDSHEAERNLRERLLPALRPLAGLGALWGHTPDRAAGLSFSVADDAAQLQASGRAINAAPPLQGQDLARIREPESVHICAVLAALPGAAEARLARLTWLAPGDDGAAAEFAPRLGALPGLACAYLLRDTATGQRFALSCWADAAALRAADPALVAGRATTYEVILRLDATPARSTAR